MDITDITNQPHVVVFRYKSDPFLTPCYSGGEHGAIDERYAIFATRDEADAALFHWYNVQSQAPGYYFSVPASVLFDVKTETVTTFTKKDLR